MSEPKLLYPGLSIAGALSLFLGALLCFVISPGHNWLHYFGAIFLVISVLLFFLVLTFSARNA